MGASLAIRYGVVEAALSDGSTSPLGEPQWQIKAWPRAGCGAGGTCGSGSGYRHHRAPEGSGAMLDLPGLTQRLSVDLSMPARARLASAAQSSRSCAHRTDPPVPPERERAENALALLLDDEVFVLAQKRLHKEHLCRHLLHPRCQGRMQRIVWTIRLQRSEGGIGKHRCGRHSEHEGPRKPGARILPIILGRGNSAFLLTRAVTGRINNQEFLDANTLEPCI